jgi:hypothetical protein
VYELIRQMGHDVDALKERIDDIIIKTLITGYPTLSKIQQTVHPDNYANDMCFEILGLDVMLDHNLVPVLLEVFQPKLRSIILPALQQILLLISTSRRNSFRMRSSCLASTTSGSTRRKRKGTLR